jgi:hypothetical protein
MSDLQRTLKDETEAARVLLANLRDIIGDDEEAAATVVEGETDLFETLAAAVEQIAMDEARAESVASVIKRFSERKSRLEARAERGRAAVAVAMDMVGIKKADLPHAVLTVKATPPKAIVTDEAAIPSRFWKPSDPKLDKKAVLDALRAGEKIDGAELSNGGTTLQIR